MKFTESQVSPVKRDNFSLGVGNPGSKYPAREKYCQAGCQGNKTQDYRQPFVIYRRASCRLNQASSSRQAVGDHPAEDNCQIGDGI